MYATNYREASEERKIRHRTAQRRYDHSEKGRRVRAARLATIFRSVKKNKIKELSDPLEMSNLIKLILNTMKILKSMKKGLRKGQHINRYSELREAILEFLSKNHNYFSVAQIRDGINQELLSNYKDRSTKTNGVRMCLKRLHKKGKIKRITSKSSLLRNKTSEKFRILY